MARSYTPRKQRARRKASRREWVAFAVLLLILGAAFQWVSRLEVTPLWLASSLGFAVGVLVTVSWQRWVARAAHRLGYIKVRGQR